MKLLNKRSPARRAARSRRARHSVRRAWRITACLAIGLGLCGTSSFARQATPVDPAADRLVTIDREAGELRIACEMLGVDVPLEFICVVTGTADHESLVRTTAAPSAIHAGLLALGMQPGRPLTWNEAAQRYQPPSGPPMTVSLEWTEAGEVRRERVGRLLKSIETGNARRPQPFVFVGSTMYDTPDGGQMYAADATGQIVSLVNFESPVVDVPALKSNENATLEWIINSGEAPRPGTAVMLVLSPIAGEAQDSGDDKAAASPPATQPATQPASERSDDRLDELRDQWEQRVLPQGAALREAAQTHYEVMQAYQDEINRLLDEADALRREMDQLQERYNELTTPQPTRE